MVLHKIDPSCSYHGVTYNGNGTYNLNMALFLE